MNPESTLAECLNVLSKLQPGVFTVYVGGHQPRWTLTFSPKHTAYVRTIHQVDCGLILQAIEMTCQIRGWDWVTSRSQKTMLTHADIQQWAEGCDWPDWSVGAWHRTPVLAMARALVQAIEKSLEPEPEDGPPDDWEGDSPEGQTITTASAIVTNPRDLWVEIPKPNRAPEDLTE
jgi:hypothetical protein